MSSPISTPKGGGAVSGLGEKFSPDLFTGTGNFSVPIALPAGRNGFQPELGLQYSTGSGNSIFGLGWNLSVPGVVRKTAKGVPIYDDEKDTFLLSGTEDLMAVKRLNLNFNQSTNEAGITPLANEIGIITQYRPRTEGLFARIYHLKTNLRNCWKVMSKNGLTSWYGSKDAFIGDLSLVQNPEHEQSIFNWKLTRTEDTFGNHILYLYEKEQVRQNDYHRWDQNYLKEIKYADYVVSGQQAYMVSVLFNYEERSDAYSDFKSGIEIRTTKRCKNIEIYTHPIEGEIKTRTYHFQYSDEVLPVEERPYNGVALLCKVEVEGHNGVNSEFLPPLEFRYTHFKPKQQKFKKLEGDQLPLSSLANPGFELIDLFGNGLQDIVQIEGVVRYWRNMGDGRFDAPRIMKDAPTGFSLGDPDVQLVDANGDGRTDLLVNGTNMAGYFSMKHDASWDTKAFKKYKYAPSFSFNDPEVKMMDMTGDGITDVVRNGAALEIFFHDKDFGWTTTKRVPKKQIEDFPNVSFADPRIKLADMSGDGMQDIVQVYNGSIKYWPNKGYGNFGKPVVMKNAPRFQQPFDPSRLQLADIDGDGQADLIYIDAQSITFWINQSGNGWSEPFEITGTPFVTNINGVRVTDIYGNGTAGVLYSFDAMSSSQRHRWFFLDLTGGVKPYLLHEMDNNMGALTRVGYLPSTRYYLKDQFDLPLYPSEVNAAVKPLFKNRKPWKTTLPFPVQVVSRVEVIDELSKGKLTTEYVYHHGYWDGGEREFRGFGRVEQRDTETFERYNESGLHGEQTFDSVIFEHYSPPTETRNWFHLGPIGDEFGEWKEIDFSDEYWQEDPNVLPKDEVATALLKSLPHRAKRDAIRVWRGSSLRSELYALDEFDSVEQKYVAGMEGRPYTVSESEYGIRLEAAPIANTINSPLGSEVLFVPKETSGYVFFSFAVSSRTTQWERGYDPMTQLSFTADFDDYGQPRKQLSAALPRGILSPYNSGITTKPVDEGGGPILATAAMSTFAQKNDEETFIVDRAARAISYEVLQQGTENVFELKNRVFAATLPMADTSQFKIIGCSINYYDGTSFVGLAYGELSIHGVITKTETLILTDEILQEAYNGTPEILKASPSWTSEYHTAFRSEMPSRLGYFHHDHANDNFAPSGYYTSAKTGFDFQDNTIINPKGLTVASKDTFENETNVTFDNYKLLPIRVTQVQNSGVNIESYAAYSYRTLQVLEMKEANGNRVQYLYSALGLLKATAQLGKTTETIGDDLQNKPSIKYEYNFHAFKDNAQPVFVKTTKRVYHAFDTDIPSGADAEETIVTIEYTDGFGRLLQTRTQAEDVIFGNSFLGDSGLPEQQGQNADAIGIQRAMNDPINVVVSGWKIYNNKGKEVEKYEPYFDKGFDFDDAAVGVGEKARLFYDSRGNVIRTINPDFTEQLVVRGIPNSLSSITINAYGNMSGYAPSPWVSYTYDANDNAGRTHTINPYTPIYHYNTPKSAVVNVVGNTVKTTEHKAHKNGTNFEDVVMRYAYDIRNNLLMVTDALGRTAFQHIYDLKPKGKDEKDKGANIIKTTHIDSGSKTIIYNAQYQPVEIRDAKDALLLSSFDELNRPVKTWARDNGAEGVTLRQKIVYGDSNASGLSNPDTTNHIGKIYQHYDEAGLITISEYDFKGNILSKIRNTIADSELQQMTKYIVDWNTTNSILDTRDFITETSYDALNRVKAVIYPTDADNKRKVLFPDYNKAGALERVKLKDDISGASKTYVEHIAYNAKGQRLLIAYSNGVMTRYAYNAKTFRLTRQRSETYQQTGFTFSSLGSVKQDTAYLYDLAGNIVAQTENRTGCGIGGSSTLTKQYAYDPMYRLLSGTGRENAPTLSPIWDDNYRSNDESITTAYTQNYSFDKMGNVLALQHIGANNFTRNFNYGSADNKLQSIDIGIINYAFAYDSCGNQILEASNRHFEWDYSDRLKSFYIDDNNSNISKFAHYLYDGDGKRIKKLVLNQQGNYDAITYINGVFEYRTDGTDEQTLVHIVDDKSHAASLRQGATFGDTTPAVKFNIEDHLGNAIVEMDENGANILREEYYPFGETSFGSYGKKRYRFNGKERDGESGLYYYGARYYNAWTCRFVNVDIKWWNFPSISPFCYAANNPIILLDENGEGPLLGGPALTNGVLKIGSFLKESSIAVKDWAVEKHYQGMNYARIGAQVNVSKVTQAELYIGAYLFGGANQLLPGFSNIEDAKSSKVNFQQGNYKTAIIFAFFAIPELGNAGKYINKATGKLFRIGGDSKFILKGVDTFGACEVFAKDFMSKIAPGLREAGATVKHFRIDEASILGMATTKTGIATNGVHEFMEITTKEGKEFIVDNMHPDGILKSDYIKEIGAYTYGNKQLNGQQLLNMAKEITK